jgi:hypothetical protein
MRTPRQHHYMLHHNSNQFNVPEPLVISSLGVAGSAEPRGRLILLEFFLY